jgi:hypothetical protein
MGAVVATYPKLPCRNCGGYRAYWVQTTWDTQQPFCGDCNSLLGTYKEMSGEEKGVAWVFAGIGIFVLGVIGFVVLQDSLESAGKRRASAREAAQIDLAKELVTEARSSQTPIERLAQLINEPEECIENDSLKLPKSSEYKFFDCNEVLQANVALNVNATTEILDDLANNESVWVRASAARNPKLSFDSQRKLFADADESVRLSLATNLQLDQGLQNLFANQSRTTSEVKVQGYFAANESLLPATYQQLASSTIPFVIIRLYCNETVPEEIRRELPKSLKTLNKNMKMKDASCDPLTSPFSFQDDWVDAEIIQELP